MPTSYNVYATGGTPVVQTFPAPIVTNRAPTSADTIGTDGKFYPLGQEWVDDSGNNIYFLSSYTSGTANWQLSASPLGAVNSLSGDSGSATPSAGVITIAGTANEITTTGSGSTITLTLPAAVIAPGTLASTTTLASGTTLTGGTGITATTGNIVASTGNITTTAGHITSATTLTATVGAITATNGNLVLNTAGNKIISTSVASTTSAGANSFGKVTLVGGTATVATTAVTANSIIFLTRMSVGSTGANPLGLLSIGTISASTSFIINAWSDIDATSLATTDVSSIGWMIVN